MHVRVLFHKDRVSRSVMRTLLDGGVPTRLQSREKGEDINHSKYVAITGRHFGAYRRVVYSGSLNVTAISEHRSDNNVIRVEKWSAARAYHEQFGITWARSRPLVRNELRSAPTGRVAGAEALDRPSPLRPSTGDRWAPWGSNPQPAD